MRKVLSIDGGGIRGIIPAIVLAEIERRTGRPTSRLFDLMAGTSTGGILALGLIKPAQGGGPEYSAKKLIEL
jgi:patatin-like phospholipase/acyl hydrolase